MLQFESRYRIVGFGVAIVARKKKEGRGARVFVPRRKTSGHKSQEGMVKVTNNIKHHLATDY